MNILNISLETKRLKLIPIDLKFSEVIFNNFTEEVTMYMYPKPPSDINDTISFIMSSIEGFKTGKNLQLGIVNKRRNEFIGCVGLHNINEDKPEIGIWIKKNSHGCGYGIEAVNRIIEWARTNLEFDYLKYPVDRNNERSRRIPERNNGVVISEYKAINEAGNTLNIIEYAIPR